MGIVTKEYQRGIEGQDSKLPSYVALMVVLRTLDEEYVLLVQETMQKPGIKRAGTKTFPVETLQIGESMENGLRRIHTEEIGRSAPVHIPDDPHEAFLGTVFVPHNGAFSPVAVYELQYGRPRYQANGDLRAIDDEVINHHFVSLDAIALENAQNPNIFRPGTPEVAKRVKNHERGFTIFSSEVDLRSVR